MMPLPVVDFHCDVLSKMLGNDQILFENDTRLDVTYERMKQGHVALQCFAIYLSERWGTPRFENIVKQIELFKSKVLPAGSGVHWLRWQEEVEDIAADQTYKGSMQHPLPWGMLSIEGADGLEGNELYAKVCFELGVRFLGITWNYANWAADGVQEGRNGGFTNKGRDLIRLCNEIGLLLDVSHLSDAGFWELVELTRRPFIASHSNAKQICPHPRNLTDEQIRAIIALDGRIGITFVPYFVKSGVSTVTAQDIIPHIEHICELGGERHLMFGSDFDGIETWVHGLEHPGKYPELAEMLLNFYSEAQVHAWFSGNALSYLQRNLPSKN